jgi:hypothetical protein
MSVPHMHEFFSVLFDAVFLVSAAVYGTQKVSIIFVEKVTKCEPLNQVSLNQHLVSYHKDCIE